MAQTWKDYFEYDGSYLPQHTGYFTAERLAREIDFLLEHVIPSKATILDLACGQGRHTIVLKKRGYEIIGVDRSEQLLHLGYEAALEANVSVEFVRQDMRDLDLAMQFDVILVLFCPFGIETDVENKKILERCARHIKPGGRIFLELHNIFRFVRRMNNPDTNNAHLDLKTLTLWDKTSGKLELPLRLYTIPELTERLRAVGLTIKAVWGGYEGQPYSFDTERLLLLAEKVA